MAKFTVLVETRPFSAYNPAPMNALKNSGMRIIDLRGSGIEDDDFVKALKQADALLCGNDLYVNEDLLRLAPKVRVIAKLGVGLDTVDIDAATRHGAIVFNTPGANNQAVADHTFALILSLARKILYCDRSLRKKRWEQTKIMGVEIWQKTIGIIGLGAIGRCVALRAKGFQMKVVAHDPYWPEEFADQQGIEQMPLDELLKVADIVSIHVPLTPENKGLINARAFKLMKSTAFLINAARGAIVDESDLYQALRNGEIGGAGLDVFEKEPPTDSPLLELDNVVLSPHTAAFTHEAIDNMCMGVVDQLIDYYQGGRPEHIVNPEVYKSHKGS
ncbi:MAG: phosphoglycerate dehydrogenase [Desulfobacterales bacterium]|jgi:D-3-phosphoglycerate dehydrogenase